MQTYNERRASLGLLGEPNQADPEPTYQELRQWAVSKGYTEDWYADGDGFSGPVLLKPATDLDSTFRAFDLDEGEFVRLNGWMGTFERVAG